MCFFFFATSQGVRGIWQVLRQVKMKWRDRNSSWMVRKPKSSLQEMSFNMKKNYFINIKERSFRCLNHGNTRSTENMANMAPGRETLEMSNLRCQRRFKRENKTGQKAMLLHIILVWKLQKNLYQFHLMLLHSYNNWINVFCLWGSLVLFQY